jgi:hypothetical protein
MSPFTPSFASFSVVGLFALVLTAAACTTPDPNPDRMSTGSEADSTFTPAPHLPLGRIQVHGGPVLEHMRLITITFPSSPIQQAVDEMGDWIVTSDYYANATAEYGVGSGTHQHIQLTEPPPAFLDDTTWFSEHVASGVLPGGTSDGEFLYLLIVPPGTKTNIVAEDTCAAFNDLLSGAWHEEAASPHRIAYAVIPTCTHEELPMIEAVISHEIVEAATDPFPFTAPGVTNDTGGWLGEIADLCNVPSVIGQFTVSSAWSNRAAAAGGDPCVPASPSYFNVSAEDPPPLAPGQTVTVDVTGWTTKPRSDWKVLAYADSFAMPGETVFTPTLALSSATINNGGHTTLTVTVPSNAARGSIARWTLLSYDEGNDQASWPMSAVVR